MNYSRPIKIVCGVGLVVGAVSVATNRFSTAIADDAETSAADSSGLSTAADEEGRFPEGQEDVVIDRVKQNVSATWAIGSEGEKHLSVQFSEDLAPQSYSFSVVFAVHLGPLSYEWLQGPYMMDVGDVFAVTPALPESAWLDPLSDEYVSVLRTKLVFYGAQSEVDRACVVWPDGRDGSPVVLTLDECQATAPYGVLSSTVADDARAGGMDVSTFIQPPIFTEARRGMADTGL